MTKLDWKFYKSGTSGPNVFVRTEYQTLLIGFETSDGGTFVKLEHPQHIKSLSNAIKTFADGLEE